MSNAPTQQSATSIRKMYRQWRKENGNHKPDRAIVKMHWEDGDNTDKGYQFCTIGLEDMNALKFKDNPIIVWYSSSLAGLLDLRQPDNGSDFILDEVLEFYKS